MGSVRGNETNLSLKKSEVKVETCLLDITMIKSNNYFLRIIKEICNELDINYEFLSKDWIIKLSKDEKIRFISGYKFDLLNHASGICFDDKYATYEVLNSIG